LDVIFYLMKEGALGRGFMTREMLERAAGAVLSVYL
jgi:hypothetical protein